MTDTTKLKWHWYYGLAVNWTRVGLGLELSFGHWFPREWSVYVVLGPLLCWFGIEEDLE